MNGTILFMNKFILTSSNRLPLRIAFTESPVLPQFLQSCYQLRLHEYI